MCCRFHLTLSRDGSSQAQVVWRVVGVSARRPRGMLAPELVARWSSGQGGRVVCE
jgi:hypothetical protein